MRITPRPRTKFLFSKPVSIAAKRWFWEFCVWYLFAVCGFFCCCFFFGGGKEVGCFFVVVLFFFLVFLLWVLFVFVGSMRSCFLFVCFEGRGRKIVLDGAKMVPI